jgi:hypothetical protein
MTGCMRALVVVMSDKRVIAERLSICNNLSRIDIISTHFTLCYTFQTDIPICAASSYLVQFEVPTYLVNSYRHGLFSCGWLMPAFLRRR